MLLHKHSPCQESLNCLFKPISTAKGLGQYPQPRPYQSSRLSTRLMTMLLDPRQRASAYSGCHETYCLDSPILLNTAEINLLLEAENGELAPYDLTMPACSTTARLGGFGKDKSPEDPTPAAMRDMRSCRICTEDISPSRERRESTKMAALNQISS